MTNVRDLFSHFWLAGACLVLAASLSAQEKGDHIPDGTQGEQLEVLEGDSVPSKWKDKRWHLFPGKFSSLKIGVNMLYEYAGFSQDEMGKKQMDSLGSVLESKFMLRDFRFTFSGKFGTKRDISWKMGLMYDGPTRSWFVRESGVMVHVPEMSSRFFVGRTKEGYSLNKVMVGYAGWTMERHMSIDVIPILADGIKWLAFMPRSRVFWNLGIFTDWLSHTQSFSTYKWQTALRVGWLPLYSVEEKKVMHVGFNFRYGQPVNGEMQMRSRPEANPAPYFISTGKFESDFSAHLGYEIYYSKGQWLLGSEFNLHHFDAATASDPSFYGGDAVVAYIITGESRPYHTETGIYGFVPVKKSVFKGGPGAWEVLLRFSTLDLDGGTIKGGQFWRLTPMVNWYLSKELRLEFAYGYGVLDRFNVKGATQFFQARLQCSFM